MRRLAPLVVVLVMVPALEASAATLDELLERSRDAAYSAEQIISCSTPDGVRDALVRIEQSGGEMRLASPLSGEVEVAAGAGSWTLSRHGGVVSSAQVEVGEEAPGPKYVLEELEPASFLGREVSAHRLSHDEEQRAVLLFDAETGALVSATTFGGEGEVYCERRFVSFDPTDPGFEPSATTAEGGTQEFTVTETNLPASAAGFDRLDIYEDEEGFRFAYYSDGFFSFAVFETPATVSLPDAVRVNYFDAAYDRSFTAGQVTYVWETGDGGMALVGDLPPDIHEDVLEALPVSERPGLFKRLWRSLFG